MTRTRTRLRAVHLAAAAEYAGELDYHARCLAGAARDLGVSLWRALRAGDATRRDAQPAPRRRADDSAIRYTSAGGEA